MEQRAAVLSSGIWRIRDVVSESTGYTPVKPPKFFASLRNPNFDFVVGWGRKPTAEGARKLAQQTGKPYVALEDGFIRSLSAGDREPPLSLVIDRTGVYYDATRPSDLEALIATSARRRGKAQLQRARDGIALLRDNALSKYNNGPFYSAAEMGLGRKPAGGRILIVDQTFGDGAIEYGLANEQSFIDMLEIARRENPRAQIIVKTHPEVISGHKKGYLTGRCDDDVVTIDYPVNPWSLIKQVDQVYVVTSQFGFEALLAGKKVTCFGAPFYAGWGLTDDRVPIPRRNARPNIEQVFAAVYFDYARYVCPDRGKEITFEEAVAHLVRRREAYFAAGAAE